MVNLIFLVLALSWIVSDHFPPWTAYHTEVPAFAAAAWALFICWRWNSERIKLPAAIWLLLGLVLSSIFQWISGQVIYGGDALVASIYLITFAAAWLWGYQWAVTGQKTALLELIGGFLLTVGLLISFQVIAQWLQVDGRFAGWVLDAARAGRPYGNVGQPNQAATVLLMGTVGAALLMRRGCVNKWVAGSAVFMLGLAMILTQSRTALLSATFLTGLFWILNPSEKEGALTRKAVVGWLLGIYLATWALHHWSLNGINAPAGLDSILAAGGRPLLWKQLLAGLLQSPWIGFGWLQIATAQQEGALLVAGIEQTNYAHNAVLDLLLVLGIPGASLVLVLVGVWGWQRVHRLRASSDATQALFVLLPFLVHMQLEFPHAYAYFLVVVGLLLGAIDAWTAPAKPWALSIPRPSLAIFAVVWSALVLAVGYEYAQAEEDYRVNRFENRRLGQTPADYSPPHLLLLTQLDGMLKAMRLRAKPGMKPEELEILLKSAKRYSWAPLQFRTALALALNGRPVEATHQLRIIKRLFAADIYDEAKENLIRMQREQYPELARVELP